MFQCRKKPTQNLLLNLDLLRTRKADWRRVLSVVARPRRSRGLEGGLGVGRRIFSGFGASLGERDMFQGSQAHYFSMSVFKFGSYWTSRCRDIAVEVVLTSTCMR
jgi:hypothetical protein